MICQYIFQRLSTNFEEANSLMIRPMAAIFRETFEIKITLILVNGDYFLCVKFTDLPVRENIVNQGTDSSHKTQMLSALSHELRTPLNSSLSLLQTSISDKNIPSYCKTEYLVPAFNSLQVLLSVVNDLLDYFQLLNNQFKLSVEKVNIKALVHKVVQLMEIQATKKNLFITTKFDQNIPEEWHTDPERFSQVLLNLVSNSVKYTYKGGIVISLSYSDSKKIIQVKVSDTGIGINSDVLPRLKKSLETLDETSLKLDNQSTGLGLGLTISNLISTILGRGYHDHIEVKSSPKGSEFSFKIEDKVKLINAIETHSSPDLSYISELGSPTIMPKSVERKTTLRPSYFASEAKRKVSHFSTCGKDSLIIMTSQTLPPPTKEIERTDSHLQIEKEDSEISDASASFIGNMVLLQKKYSKPDVVRKKVQSFSLSRSFQGYIELPSDRRKILIVDDDTFNVHSMELVLKGLGMSTESAYNGLEAVNRVQSQKFDLIMMDCNMPIMDGWEATKKIRKMIHQKTIEDLIIVGCTAYEDAESLNKCYEAGMKYIIQKPITREKVAKLLDRLW
jgi:Signal transduction histidine kinase